MISIPSYTDAENVTYQDSVWVVKVIWADLGNGVCQLMLDGYKSKADYEAGGKLIGRKTIRTIGDPYVSIFSANAAGIAAISQAIIATDQMFAGATNVP